MRNILYILTIIALTSCSQKADSVNENKLTDSLSKAVDNKLNVTVDIFADNYFPFFELDSIDEGMLRDKSVKGDIKYKGIFKRLKSEHYKFFNYRGVQDTFFEEHYFLISRQKMMNGKKSIIIHSSGDFNYYSSDMYILDQSNKKIDSVQVSHWEYETGGDEPYSFIGESKTKFKGDLITTTILEFKKFDNDSTVTTDSTIVYRQINKDGHIVTLKNEKIL